MERCRDREVAARACVREDGSLCSVGSEFQCGKMLLLIEAVQQWEYA